MDPSHPGPINVREYDAEAKSPDARGSRLLKALHDVASCGSFGAAAQAVQSPEALATPLPVRSLRQIRTARVSWW